MEIRTKGREVRGIDFTYSLQYNEKTSLTSWGDIGEVPPVHCGRGSESSRLTRSEVGRGRRRDEVEETGGDARHVRRLTRAESQNRDRQGKLTTSEQGL